MARMTITVEGSDMTLELLKRAMAESPRTTFCPESIHPGYSLEVVEVKRERIRIEHPLFEAYPDGVYLHYDLELLAMTYYDQRSRSPRHLTEEDWENVKARFPASARSCYDDVLSAIENGELDD